MKSAMTVFAMHWDLGPWLIALPAQSTINYLLWHLWKFSSYLVKNLFAHSFSEYVWTHKEHPHIFVFFLFLIFKSSWRFLKTVQGKHYSPTMVRHQENHFQNWCLFHNWSNNNSSFLLHGSQSSEVNSRSSLHFHVCVYFLVLFDSKFSTIQNFLRKRSYPEYM